VRKDNRRKRSQRFAQILRRKKVGIQKRMTRKKFGEMEASKLSKREGVMYASQLLGCCEGQEGLQIWGSCDCPNLWKVSEGTGRFMLQLSSHEKTKDT
jgi:hypothetical protein